MEMMKNIMRILGDRFPWIMKILGGQSPILGDQSPWRGGLLRLLALSQCRRCRRKKILYFWHNVDAPWVNTGSSKVMWTRGYGPPSYCSTAFQALIPGSESVRQSLKAPHPFWWLIGPRTDITIAEWEEELMEYLEEVINILNEWYSHLATWAGYQFMKIPLPSKSGSILEWVEVLGKMIGIDSGAVVYTTSLAFFGDHDRQKQIREEVAHYWGKWWAIDVNTLRRSEWYNGKPLPEGAILVPKGRYLPSLLVQKWGYPLYATRLPYVDDPSLYQSISLEISEEDKRRLTEAFRSKYLEKKRARGEVFDSLPKIVITPDRPDALSFLALGYGVDATIDLGNGKVVSFCLQRGS